MYSAATSLLTCFDSVFVNGRSRPVIMEDMERRINRGDIELEKQEAIQVSEPSRFPPYSTSPAIRPEIQCHLRHMLTHIFHFWKQRPCAILRKIVRRNWVADAPLCTQYNSTSRCVIGECWRQKQQDLNCQGWHAHKYITTENTNPYQIKHMSHYKPDWCLMVLFFRFPSTLRSILRDLRRPPCPPRYIGFMR